MRFLTLIFLSVSMPVLAQPDKARVSPTAALENMNFQAIDYAQLDSGSRDYIRGIDCALNHRFETAERLLTSVGLRTGSSLSIAARSYLLNDLYFWPGKYADYVRFAERIGDRSTRYSLAKRWADLPPRSVVFSADSILLPISIRGRSYAIAEVILNGIRAQLILDTGADYTIISQRLSDRLGLVGAGPVDLINALGTTVGGSFAFLDSLSLGNVRVKHAPIVHTANSGFLKHLHVDGLLGWDVLSTLCYTIDFKGKTLLIRKPVSNSSLSKNLFGTRMPLISVQTTSGIPLHLFFDSGANSVDLTAKGAAKLGPYKIRRRLGMVMGIGKMKIGLFRYVKKFSFLLDSQLFNRRQTYLTPVDRFILNVRSDGVMSNRPFQQGRLTIDYLNNYFGYTEN